MKTAKDLKKKLSDLVVNYGSIAGDDWNSFAAAFNGENHCTGEKYTIDTEGNNYRLRHRIRWAFRKTFCFSKNLFKHLNTFNPTFFYINFGFV
jgi:IS1 family transposase